MQDRRYHILYATTNSELGGGEISLLTLAANLDRERFHYSVICPHGPLAERLEASGIGVCPMELESFASYGGIVPRLPWRTLWSVFRYARKTHVDLVHSHHYEASKIFGLVARCLNVPSLWTCHGFWFPVSGMKGRYLATVIDHTVAVSQFVKRKLLEGGVLREESVSVVYNGVGPEFWEKEFDPVSLRQEFKISNSAFLVGVVGRIGPGKGHKDFLVAFKDVVEQKPQVRALLVGKSLDLTYQGELESLVGKLGISQQVIFTGFRRDTTKVFDALDLLVLPSKGESFPLVLIEAMARQKPIVATDCGGPSEALGNNQHGLLVPPENPSELARVILRVMNDDKLRHQIAKAGRRRAEKEFTTERMVRENERIYLKLLNGRRRP